MSVSIVDNYLKSRKQSIKNNFNLLVDNNDLGKRKISLAEKVMDKYIEEFVIGSNDIDNIRVTVEKFLKSNGISDVLRKKTIKLLFEVDSFGYYDDYILLADALALSFYLSDKAFNAKTKVNFTKATSKYKFKNIRSEFIIENFAKTKKQFLSIYKRGQKIQKALNEFDQKEFRLRFYPLKSKYDLTDVIIEPIYSQMGKIDKFKVDEQIIETNFLDKQNLVAIEILTTEVLKHLLLKDEINYVLKVTDDFFKQKSIMKLIKEICATEQVTKKICLEFKNEHFLKHQAKIEKLSKLGYQLAIDEIDLLKEDIDANKIFDYVILDDKPKGEKLDVKIVVRDNDDVELLMVS